ncbi:hypothetical protein CFC35_10545 [Streptomyces sp. FBKL.4005]|uniref:hypothetical protein n=1 Tax=unclassified Streptomyces TaxID=2593676 RepID=UPI000B971333|nr:hypothetical protein [Streptomyces sp. FBKL.4005]OYP14885.1 hypothetical protein CFC35_10545 [Streptomyces sp. FBKL.4005]
MLALSANGRLPRADYAIFANTGWKPHAVYRHLDRLQKEIAAPAGIPILRVSSGNVRRDALDPAHRFASMPLDILNQDGKQGMTRRQCTGERQAFLHRSRVPLDRAPIDHVTAAEWAARQQELDDRASMVEELENGVVDGCSPWACRGEAEPVQDDFGLAS